jgi:hypothetical protein
VSETQEYLELDGQTFYDEVCSVETELLLLAMEADGGGPMIEIDLTVLSEQEKRLALELLRRHFGQITIFPKSSGRPSAMGEQ